MPGSSDSIANRRVQYAALPYRQRQDGEVQVRLITSRETRRWVIPKGWPMKGLPPHKAAAREAFEEAGLLGATARNAIGMYTYEKRLSPQRSLTCDVMVFPMRVKRYLKKWPERSQRIGFWFTIESAAAAVQEEELRDLILRFGAAMAARFAEGQAAKAAAAEALAPEVLAVEEVLAELQPVTKSKAAVKAKPADKNKTAAKDKPAAKKSAAKKPAAKKAADEDKDAESAPPSEKVKASAKSKAEPKAKAGKDKPKAEVKAEAVTEAKPAQKAKGPAKSKNTVKSKSTTKSKTTAKPKAARSSTPSASMSAADEDVISSGEDFVPDVGGPAAGAKGKPKGAVKDKPAAKAKPSAKAKPEAKTKAEPKAKAESKIKPETKAAAKGEGKSKAPSKPKEVKVRAAGSAPEPNLVSAKEKPVAAKKKGKRAPDGVTLH